MGKVTVVKVGWNPKVQGLEFRVRSLEFRVQGSRLRL